MYTSCDTVNAIGFVGTTFFHTCHSIIRIHLRGNQHVRTEHGKCSICGRPFRRRITWATRKAEEWEAS